jgi:eukaryotic-like serine/threonine-protein kinase
VNVRERAESVFEAALELEPSVRDAHMAEACAGDAVLLAQVKALLSAHERAGGILEDDPRRLLGGDPLPERLGAYRIVREIGRGGMGLVYHAERDDGQFVRRVAIKVLRAADDPGLRQRVHAERQILAALDHPNIARLLDGGVSADGRPYLVMEHVDGLPLDIYCERMRLSVAERLRLFVVIVRCVAYAHRNLVVHRDLKPSNILVTADGTPKLLDFGIARLLNPGLGGVTADTLHGALELTPEYASPEQLRGESVTTQSDIYSLGVLLYELLTGRRPFHGRGLAELVPQVCDADPVRPSERVRRDEDVVCADGSVRSVRAAAVARSMHATPDRLTRLLRGDVDAITCTALRKEPRNRYASADLLVEDVERSLAGRPIAARPIGWPATVLRLARRHRVTAASLVISVLALFAGAGGALWQARVAHAERDRAALAQQEAERVAEFVLDLFESATPEAAAGQAITARDLVQRGVARVDDLAAQPAVQASLLGVLGRVLESIAEYEQAQQMTERALALHEAGSDELGAARMYHQRALVLRRRGEYAAAEESLVRARDIRVRLLGPAHPELGPTYHDLARMSVYLGDMQEAQRRADEAYDIQRSALGETHPATLQSRMLAGVVQRRRGRVDEAEQTIRAVIALRPRSVGSTRHAALQDRLQLGDLLTLAERDLAEAERIFRDVLGKTDSSNPEDLFTRFWAKGSLVSVLARRGDVEAALSEARELRVERQAVYGADHPLSAPDLIARLLVRAGRPDEAEPLYRETLDAQRARFGERHPVYMAALTGMTELYLARGEQARADSVLEHVLAARIAESGPDGPDIPDLLWRRARTLTALGRYEDAELLLHDALGRATRKQLGAVLPFIHEAYADLYRALGRTEDADRHQRLGRAR